ncbi:3 beta-hydroxysteroid dehydrogenase/Delta 5--_4-isomerase type 1 [Ischnura elegans]|uniref:3 beta-hydroxysteroid dehydrogenase/Delta 5-->4-isomerase type 1 n=1 Tax=Ischnura elegans TaxID=197161 RepID=UPI001ED8B0B1|nr:3 beta-hydroxysteroid dehydrogenase/Delta 5-->4-isomerase type 1 [Ischnura elegans]
MGKTESNGDREVVLVTGGSGFLGQHIIRELQEHDDSVTEIRVIDRQPYKNKLGHKEPKRIITYIGDLRDKSSESVRKAFSDVDCVIHAAGLVSYHFPVDIQGLHDHNVLVTRNVVSLCIEEGIDKLVFCSTAEVTLVPYFGSNISVVVFKTEAKALPPKLSGEIAKSTPSSISKDKGLITPGYPYSKLRAETIVLEANGSPLRNGNGVLKTVALRPTLLYGEEDYKFVPEICKLADACDGRLIQISGIGGKQQVTYAGNAAWAHLCAKNALKKHPESIAGLPIFVTDDTHLDNTLRFVERVTGGRGPNPRIPNNNSLNDANAKTERSPYHVTEWSIPMVLSYLVAILFELIMSWLVCPLFQVTLTVSPSAFISYLGSVVFFSRLRASIYMDYEPLYSMEEAIMSSSEFYARVRQMNTGKLGKPQKRNLLRLNVGDGGHIPNPT